MGKTNGNFVKKSSKKFYNMRGCSKKTRKNYLGGSTNGSFASNVPLAYTGQPIQTVPNPFLAYTGKGGSSCGLSNSAPIPVNTNAANPTIPNTGPVPTGQIFFNPSSPQHGGSCPSCNMIGGGCGCGLKLFGGKKGGCGPLCAVGFMVGGKRHRLGCKCSKCKSKNMKGGNPGIPYPNGLVGTPWTSDISSWPGVNGVPGDGNYYTNNTYNNDVSRQMVDVGANRPFLKGGKKNKSRKQRGGTLSNFIGQDLINLGRQFQFGVGSAYNALAGYSSPVNPLPWKDQFPASNKFNPSTI